MKIKKDKIMQKLHSFHIPVMGIGFTIDSPLKVSQYGIDSVISLVDDILIEKMRKLHCEKNQIRYIEISNRDKDFRAKRITAYLNLLKELTTKKFDELTSLKDSNELKKYFNLLPNNSKIKQKFKKENFESLNTERKRSWLNENLKKGSIDVNIMTKLDKENYLKGEKLPTEYNDAHAALRGYAQSDLESSIVLSAGMNPKLYNYIENFEDFFPDKYGNIKKKIVLKVSDYRSALIQGKLLAKKGIWVSEYRIESGLNCGGHAFATNGFLMGPILNEFKENRKELSKTVNELLNEALYNKNRTVPNKILSLKITAQGGVGTKEEHDFLIKHYEVDSVGWGSPFLLVPEATTVDNATINQLAEAKEEDLYLSNISPLGVPFNSLRGNTMDLEKISKIKKGKAGSSCPKKYLSLNNEFGDKKICTASRQYQKKKLNEIEKENLSQNELSKKREKILEKSCICVGLGTSAMLANNLNTEKTGTGVSVCPGPNMAYFSKKMSLEEIVSHIYRKNKYTNINRPHMFIKELKIYVEYINSKINELKIPINSKQKKYFSNFIKNLQTGISYYFNLFININYETNNKKFEILSELYCEREGLKTLSSKIEKMYKKKKIPVFV